MFFNHKSNYNKKGRLLYYDSDIGKAFPCSATKTQISIKNDIIGLPRTESALKADKYHAFLTLLIIMLDMQLKLLSATEPFINLAVL